MPSILLIDDMTEFRRNIAEVLQFEGLEVIQADNPLSGFARMRQHRPDLILLDLNFSGFNGLNFIEWVRQSQACADIPIIVLSAFKDTEWVEEAISAGANEYLAKPSTVMEVIEIIQKYLVHT